MMCYYFLLLFIDAWSNLSKLVAGDALLLLIDSFVDLLNGISTELMNLTEIVRTSLPVQDLFSCLLYTSPSPRDATLSRMPSSA